MSKPALKKTSMKLLALSIAAGFGSAASAVSLVDNDEWNIRWDNKIKYQAVFRTESPDEDIWETSPAGEARAPLFGESTRNFSRSNLGLVSHRLDLTSELDIIWNDKAGVRISAAAWYDDMYNRGTDWNGSPLMWNGLTNDPGEFKSHTAKWAGNNAEIMDAFVFYNWQFGDIYGNWRLGRHTVYYGNSLLPIGVNNSIAGAMTQLDIARGLGSPGSEAKEIFMPSNKLSTVIQLSDNVTLNAFYQLEWERNRAGAPGSFWGVTGSGFTEGSEFGALLVDPVNGVRYGATQRAANEPKDEGSVWGMSLQYAWEEQDVELAFTYINTTKFSEANLVGVMDFNKFMYANNSALAGVYGLANSLAPLFGTDVVTDFVPDMLEVSAGNTAAGSFGEFQWVFKDDIDVYGISAAKEVAGISLGLDLTYWKNAQLRGDLNAMLLRMVNIPNLPTAEQAILGAVTPIVVQGALADPALQGLLALLGVTPQQLIGTYVIAGGPDGNGAAALAAINPNLAGLGAALDANVGGALALYSAGGASALAPISAQLAAGIGGLEALRSTAAAFSGAAFPDAPNGLTIDMVSAGNHMNPVGDVATLVFNGIGFLDTNDYWDGGSYIFEVTLAKLLKVTENAGYMTRNDSTVRDGVSTHAAFIFRPTWYQVMPGVDLTVPVNIGYGFDGSSPLTTGFNRYGNWGIGADFNVNNTWNVAVKYSSFFGSADNSIAALYKDRDNIALTVQRTF